MNIQYKDVANKSTAIGDEAAASEAALMAEYFRAEAAYRDVLAKVQRNSIFYNDSPLVEAFDDHTHDYAPSPDHWADKLSEVTPPQRN